MPFRDPTTRSTAIRSGSPVIGASAFVLLLVTGCTLGAAIHIAFGLLFWRAGATAMAQINVASVLVYLLSGLLLRHRRLGWSMAMMALEVIAHAVAAVIVVGWDGGFHFYLLLLIPAILASRLSGWPPKIAAATAVGLIYTTLDSCWRQAPPLQPINSLILTQLHHFNLVATLFLLGVLTVVYVRMIDRAETRLNEQANTDSLTQLVNRRSILAAIERQQALRQRNPHPLCLIIIDIDHFKLLNDAHGHALGDRALQAVAKALQQGVREIDLVARWGGEEFLVVLPFADMDVAVPVAERLRESIAALRIEHQGQLLSMTGTLGLSELAVGEAADTGIQRADAALYRGKNGGRDQVVVG